LQAISRLFLKIVIFYIKRRESAAHFTVFDGYFPQKEEKEGPIKKRVDIFSVYVKIKYSNI